MLILALNLLFYCQMNKFIYKQSPTYKKSQDEVHQRFLGALFITSILAGMTVWCSYRDTKRVEALSDNTEFQVVVTQEATSTPQVIITSTIAPKSQVVAKAEEIVANRYADSPFLINNRLQKVYDQLDHDDNKFKVFVGIAGTESAFGQFPMSDQMKNAWGYICTRKDKQNILDCGWKDWDYSMKRYVQLEKDNWLAKFDGNKSSLDQYVGKGKYCASACTTWTDSVWWFIKEFD